MTPSALRALVPSALAAVLALVAAGPAPAEPPADSPAPRLNKKVDGVRFVGADGKPFALADLKDSKAVVVLFLSFECPVSNSYSAALADLARDYGAKGVRFVGVCPGEDDAAEVARQAKEQRLPFPV